MRIIVVSNGAEVIERFLKLADVWDPPAASGRKTPLRGYDTDWLVLGRADSR